VGNQLDYGLCSRRIAALAGDPLTFAYGVTERGLPPPVLRPGEEGPFRLAGTTCIWWYITSSGASSGAGKCCSSRLDPRDAQRGTWKGKEPCSTAKKSTSSTRKLVSAFPSRRSSWAPYHIPVWTSTPRLSRNRRFPVVCRIRPHRQPCTQSWTPGGP